MKKGAILGIGLLILLFYINGCGLNNRADPGLENGVHGQFSAHDYQRGEGFGLWNQQRDRRNPIANIVSRDDRPGRGMNGITDRLPPDMTRRISRFDVSKDFDLEKTRTTRSLSNDNISEQLTFELLQNEEVRDVRIVSSGRQLLVAVDSDSDDKKRLKQEISDYLSQKYPDQQIVVITDRQAVDRVKLLDDGKIN